MSLFLGKKQILYYDGFEVPSLVIHALLERALSSLQLRAQVTPLRPGDSGCPALSFGEEDVQWHLPCGAVLRRGRGQSPKSQRSFTRRLWFSAAIEAVWDEAEKPSRVESLGHGVPGPPPPALPATPGWYLSRCSSQAGAISLGAPWGPLSYSPSQGALAPIQGAGEVPGPVLSLGLRTLSDDLVGVLWVFFKECYPQPFEQVLI